MQESATDRDLVSACVGGNVRAFGALVERHHAAVTAVAFAIVRDVSLAEDIAQDTFIVAWTRLAELRDPASVRAWLCNIARNQSKNEMRRRARDAEHDDAIADDRDSPADVAIAHETAAQLRDALAQVPATYREPLVLFYWHEHSIEQVASALAISAQAAQKRISRARSMLGEQYAARLEASAHGRRAAKVAAAAIVAVLTVRATPAAAASTAGRDFARRGLMKLVIAVFAASIVGIVGWQIVADRGASASAPDSIRSASGPPRQPTAVSVAPHAAPGPTLGSGSGSAAHTSQLKGSFGTPDAYELTVLAPTTVAVNLAGGKSDAFLFRDPPAPTFERRVRGRVVDEAGKPVAGAVVLVGDEFPVIWGSMTADAGAVTNQSGAFDMAVHLDTSAIAVALHAKLGWSAEVGVPAGRSDAEIELRVARPATLSGEVRLANEPIESEVHVIGNGFLLAVETDTTGRFELGLLPPGAYRVSARPLQKYAGGTSKGTEQVVTLESGRNARVALTVAPGALVVITSRGANDLTTIEYVLVPGTDVKPDAAELRALSRSHKALAYLLGGHDLDTPMQFHDVALGDYTLCIIRKRAGQSAVTCQKLVVDKSLVELVVP